MSSRVKDRTLRLAAYVGMPIRFIDNDYRPGYSWDGHELFVPPERTVDQIQHEICHFIESEGDPGRRRLPEFGLGRAPYKHLDNEGADLMSPFQHMYELDMHEVSTCMLEIWYVRHTRGPWRRRADDLNFFPQQHETWKSFWASTDWDLNVFDIDESGALDIVREFVKREGFLW